MEPTYACSPVITGPHGPLTADAIRPYEIAQNSSQHARAIFFDREIKRVTEIAWDQAVNDTANLWQSIFWNALGPKRAGRLYGIPEPVREIGNGSLC
jgi:hypothetical protein